MNQAIEKSNVGETRRVRYVQPRTSIHETHAEFLLELEMPGVKKEDLSVHVESNELVVIGDRRPHDMPGEVIHREIRPFQYRRSFELDPGIHAAGIQAKLEHGVVRLVLPKAAEVQPRKIEVTV